jgi:uncharacterized protein with HEPN domain
MDRDRDIIIHITEHIKDVFNARDRLGNDFSVFSKDRVYFNAVCISLLQIGELAKNNEWKSHAKKPMCCCGGLWNWKSLLRRR